MNNEHLHSLQTNLKIVNLKSSFLWPMWIKSFRKNLFFKKERKKSNSKACLQLSSTSSTRKIIICLKAKRAKSFVLLINTIRLIVQPHNALTVITLPHFGCKKVKYSVFLFLNQHIWTHHLKPARGQEVASPWKKPHKWGSCWLAEDLHDSGAILPTQGPLTLRVLVVFGQSQLLTWQQLAEVPHLQPNGESWKSGRVNPLPPLSFPHSTSYRTTAMEIKGASVLNCIMLKLTFISSTHTSLQSELPSICLHV